MPRDNSCSRVPPTFHECASPVNPRGAPQCTQPQSQGYTDAPSRSRRERPPHPPSALLPRPTERAAPGSAGHGPRHPPTCPSDAQNHGQPTVTGALGAERPRVAWSSPTPPVRDDDSGVPPRKPRRSARRVPDWTSRPGLLPPARHQTPPAEHVVDGLPTLALVVEPRADYACLRPTQSGVMAATRDDQKRGHGAVRTPSECPLRSPPGGGPRGPSDASPDAITH